jgi:hypothetical protein
MLFRTPDRQSFLEPHELVVGAVCLPVLAQVARPGDQKLFVGPTATATLDTNCDNAGIVFGYLDHQNFWALVWSKAQGKQLLYEVSEGTWTLRKQGSVSISNGVAFTMSTWIGSGGTWGYDATMPAGQALDTVGAASRRSSQSDAGLRSGR